MTFVYPKACFFDMSLGLFIISSKNTSLFLILHLKWRNESHDKHVYFLSGRLFTLLTIPITKTLYVDSLTPVDLFQRVQDEAVYLLESNDDTSPWSNYSFIGLNPFYMLRKKMVSTSLKTAIYNRGFQLLALKMLFKQWMSILK